MVQAPIGSAGGFVLVGLVVVELGELTVEDVAGLELLTDELVFTAGVEEGLPDAVDDAPLELPLEQALSATRPHAATATTLSRRVLTGDFMRYTMPGSIGSRQIG